jgi:uncharacterized membrane protein YkvA (DUF1232 family)
MSTLPKPSPSGLVQIIQTFRLAIKLFFSPKVPTWTKVVPILALAYVIFPLDFIPDFIPGLGQLDDLTVLLLFTWVFMQLVPQDVVRTMRGDSSVVNGEYRVIKDDKDPPPSSGQIAPPKQ